MFQFFARRPVALPIVLGLVFASCLFAASTPAEEEPSDPLNGLELRNIGPYNMSGRVTDVEGIPGDPRVVYVGAAAGGVWKTVNGGLTFEPIFDDQPIASIGDLALAPSNPEVIYVGSGEANVRNSVSFGNGVYKSTDGGQSWKHLGLEETRHISRVLVHPHDPETVYVGALGHIFDSNEERGVYRSRDGGANWEKVLYTDEHHGVADLDMHPGNPNLLFAALWSFERKPWTMQSGGEEGGVYRSVDGGTTWKKLTEGLPKLMGRIGVKVAPSNPRVVYVIAESNEGTLFRSNDGGDTFEKVSDEVNIVSRGFYYTDLRVDPTDENRVYAISSRLFRSIDGGRNFERIARSIHVDFHSLWIDPKDPQRVWNGQDGGVAVSYDRGDTWEPIRNLPLAQFYQIFYDTRRPFYYLGGGLQDNGTWYGPSRSREPSGIQEDDWRMMSFGDAYWVVPHPEQVDLFLSEYQAGGIVRTDMRNRQQIDVSPQPRRNDGGPAEELEYRFNWNSPIVASPHDPHTVYFAGNVVFKTTDFGDSWEVISPDLTTNDPEKLGPAGGPVWPENTTAEYHCTILSFAESPVEPGVLWVGTDDGNLQLSRDGGGQWTNLAGRVPGMPEFSPVSHVEPSRTAAGTAYVSFDRHMFNDFRPHIWKTTDFGATWRRTDQGIDENAWVWVVREDLVNPELLYAGTELGLYASFDAGASWRALDLGELPTVPVQDVLIHPREHDLLVGTHGRALWMLDDSTPLRQWNSVPADASAHLFEVRSALRHPQQMTRYGLGDKEKLVANPAYGALITYLLRESLEPPKAGEEGDEGEWESPLRLEILDASGTVVRTLDELGTEAGLQRIVWDLAMDPPFSRTPGKQEGGDFDPPPSGPQVLPGTYTARLTLGDEEWETPVLVEVDPTLELPPGALEAQHHMAYTLRDLRSGVNRVLRGVDLLKAQLVARRGSLDLLERELPAEVEAQWQAFEEALEQRLVDFVRSDEKPFWSQGPRLGDRLGDLFNKVDGAFAAPTAAQQEHLEELQNTWRDAMMAWNRFLREDAPALDAALTAQGMAGLTLPEEVEVEKGSG